MFKRLAPSLISGIDESAILGVLNGKVSFANAKEREQFIAQMHREMLRHIDEWIDSGRDTNGSESPKSRNFTRAQSVLVHVRSCLEHYVVLQPSPNDPREIQLLPKRWNIPPVSREIRLLPKRWKSFPVLDARTENAFVLATIILSDLRERLAKCRYRNCGQYFVMSKVREKPQKNGLFCCTVHNRRESAMRRTQNRREKSDTLLLERAARELLSHGTDVDVKTRIVKVLNKIIRKDPNHPRHGLSMNWVTRHQREIETKAEELRHAKAQAAR